jgi:hypothetical protein
MVEHYKYRSKNNKYITSVGFKPDLRIFKLKKIHEFTNI